MTNTLNIFAVVDEFTFSALSLEDNVNIITQKNFLDLLFPPKIDLLFVESAWLGTNNRWKYGIAHYPDHPERNNKKLIKLVHWAKSRNIPTVFWNKEDPFHFDQFIDSASLFDFVFTTDVNMIPRYRQRLNHSRIYNLPFPFQPKIHYPTSITDISNKSSLFVGSYNRNMHSSRQQWQDMCFQAAAPYGLSIVDRHADSHKSHHQFPNLPNTQYLASVPYHQTGKLYRQYQQSINVNTITDSPTMFSRRVLEIMACGRLMITNPSLAIEQHFAGFCEIVHNEEQAIALFEQLSHGYTSQQIEMINSATEKVFENYTVKAWLQRILGECGINHSYLNDLENI